MTTMQHTLDSAKNLLHGAQEDAQHAVGAAKHGAEHVAATARSSFLDGVRTVTDLVATIRSLRSDDALGWVGLERRRGPLASLGTFGLGLATGAGVALLLAPRSGEDTRRALLQFLSGNRDPRVVLTDTEGKVKDAVMEAAATAGHGVENAAHKVQEGASDVAHKVQQGASDVAHTVRQGVGDAARTVQHPATTDAAHRDPNESAATRDRGAARPGDGDAAGKPMPGRGVAH